MHKLEEMRTNKIYRHVILLKSEKSEMSVVVKHKRTYRIPLTSRKLHHCLASIY